jgi:hypothetical protein
LQTSRLSDNQRKFHSSITERHASSKTAEKQPNPAYRDVTIKVAMRGAILSLAVLLVGCTLRNPKQTAVATPPTPAAAAPQPVAEAPYSIAQTNVILPPPQPVNPDSIPAAPVEPPPAPEKVEQPPAVKPVRRAVTTNNSTAKPEPEQPAPPAPAASAPSTEAGGAIQPILSADEQKRLQETIVARRREIDDLLSKAKGHSHDTAMVDRITSFLNLSAAAEKRGDYTQADALSERALILARELQVQ